jgi:RNA polymerase sigma-70 factor (ECF subfamily)
LHPPQSVQSYGEGTGQDVPEELLVQRAADGDPAAFDWLMRRYQDAVFNMLYRMTGNQDLAFDLVQETFLKAYRSIDTFRLGARFYTWVYRIAVNSLRSHWRKQGRLPTEQSLDEDPGQYIAPSTSNNPADLAEAGETDAIVQRSISTLPEYQRMVLVLRDVEGLEYEQIAETLQLNIGTVKSRLHRARMTLKDKLSYLWEG